MSERETPSPEKRTEMVGKAPTSAPQRRVTPGRGDPPRNRIPRDDEDDDIDATIAIDDEDVPAADDADYDDGDTAEEGDSFDVSGPAEFQPRARREQRGRRDYRGGYRGRQTRSDVRIEDVSYKNIDLLSRFVDPRGRILSRRKTKVSAKLQRLVTRAIKQARELALLPYTGEHIRVTRKR